MMQIVGATNGESGEKRAESDGEAGGLRGGGGNQADGDGDEQEKFGIFGARDEAEKAGNECHGKNCERDEQECGFAESPGGFGEAAFGGAAEDGDDDGHEDDGDVFDQGDADHYAAVGGAHGVAVGEEAGKDHGAGDGDGGADDEALDQGPSDEPRGAERERHREQNAECAAAEGDPFHAQQVGDGKFHADGKHQQDYADFGEYFEGVQVGDVHAGSEGADDDAAKDEAEDQGEFQAPGYEPAQDGGEEDVG